MATGGIPTMRETHGRYIPSNIQLEKNRGRTECKVIQGGGSEHIHCEHFKTRMENGSPIVILNMLFYPHYSFISGC